MAKFISSFTVGFDRIIRDITSVFLKSVHVIDVYDGLIYYEYDGRIKDIEKIHFFSNTFYVIQTFAGKNLDFSGMVSKTEKKQHDILMRGKTFRVRFSKENQFKSVGKQISRRAECIITKQSGYVADRLNPDTEFWYLIRRENIGFYCQLLKKRENTEAKLIKGALRPEFAFLMCCFADIQPSDILCDPFAGYGTIPLQASKHFVFNMFYVSDQENEKVENLRQQLSHERIDVRQQDALHLGSYKDKIDKIITDPPWGYYENISDIPRFYTSMFNSFQSVLSDSGKIIILSARKQEIEHAAATTGFSIVDRLNTLVNGKKASIYKLSSDG